MSEMTIEKAREIFALHKFQVELGDRRHEVIAGAFEALGFINGHASRNPEIEALKKEREMLREEIVRLGNEERSGPNY